MFVGLCYSFFFSRSIQLDELKEEKKRFNSLLFVLACNHFSPSGLMFAFRRFCFQVDQQIAMLNQAPKKIVGFTSLTLSVDRKYGVAL